MYAALSLTACETPSLSVILSSSRMAMLRFFALLPKAGDLLSHFLSLSMELRMGESKVLPEASLFDLPIIVESPMSLYVIDMGAPPLALSSPFSSLKLRHSGPWSTECSVTTKPQLLHESSPVLASSTSVRLPHWGHLSETCSADVLGYLILSHYTTNRGYPAYLNLVVILELVGIV